jgi:hypothetical protein
MVEAAKAFCPECGTSMEVEEQRKTTTEFNLYDGTERLSRSDYNILIKAMDLDISESPPIIKTVQEAKPQSVAENPSKSNAALWIIIGVGAFAVLMIFLLAVAGVFFYMRR